MSRPKKPRRVSNCRYDCGSRGDMTVAQIACASGLSASGVYARLERGWTGKKILSAKQCEGYAGPKKYDCGAAGMLTADEISRRTKVRIGTIYSRASNGVTGDALMLPKQPTRAPGAPRTDSMVTACRLTKLAHEIGRLPSVARIREARPMSRQAAERWLCALRVALDHVQANNQVERQP